MLLWGLSYIWSKVVFEYIGPASTIMLRLLISAMFLWAVASLIGQRPAIRRIDIKLFLLSSLFNPFLYFIGESYGLNLVSPVLSAVIIATIPVFMPIVAFFYLRERLKPMNITGLIISFAGVLVMIFRPDLSLAASPAGIALLFGAVASALVYGILLRKLTMRYTPLVIITIQNSIGAIYFVPIVLLFEFDSIRSISPDGRMLSSLFALGIFASSLAYVFYTKTVQSLGIARANLYTNLIPVFTALFSFFVLGENMNTAKIIGIVLVMGGVFLSQQNRKAKLVT
jgi:drug/metabolite transporter (DMT)-like permease